jgi:hypothetical protein
VKAGFRTVFFPNRHQLDTLRNRHDPSHFDEAPNEQEGCMRASQTHDTQTRLGFKGRCCRTDGVSTFHPVFSWSYHAGEDHVVAKQGAHRTGLGESWYQQCVYHSAQPAQTPPKTLSQAPGQSSRRPGVAEGPMASNTHRADKFPVVLSVLLHQSPSNLMAANKALLQGGACRTQNS